MIARKNIESGQKICYTCVILQKGGDSIKTELKAILVENSYNPFGITTPVPRYSFIIDSAVKGIVQRRYKIHVESIKGTVFWDSGWVESDRSFDILHCGTPLICDEEYRIEVMVDLESVQLRKTADFSTALFTPDTSAKWVGAKSSCVSPLLRNTFFAGKKAKSAKAYISATGFFRLYINDKYVGTHQAVPTFTQKGDCYFESYDITNYVSPDNNTVGVWLAQSKIYTKTEKPLAVSVVITMTYYDGSSKRFYSDENWIWYESPITDIRDSGGETYNKNAVIKKWADPYINTANWKSAEIFDLPPAKPAFCEKTAKLCTVPAKFFEARDDEVTFCDFEQSSYGRLKIIITGEPGTKIVITYYNGFLPDGTPDILPDNEDEYIIKGYEIEAYEPRFSGRFFRYAEVRMDGVAQLIYAEKVIIGTKSKPLIKLNCPTPSVRFRCEKTLKPLFKNISQRLACHDIYLKDGVTLQKGNDTPPDAPLYFEEVLLKNSYTDYCNQFFALAMHEKAQSAKICTLLANEICKTLGVQYSAQQRTVYINTALSDNCDTLSIEYLSPCGKIGAYLRRIGTEIHEDFVIPVGTRAVVTLPNGAIKTLVSGKYLYEQLN